MIFLLAVLSLFILFRYLSYQGGYVTFPAMFAGLYIAWVLPQVNSFADSPLVPEGGYVGLTFMALFCLLAAWAGWTLTGKKVVTSQAEHEPFDPQPLVIPTTLVTVVSVALNALLDSMRPEMADVSQWSGPITIVAFFAQIRNVALVMSLLLLFQYRTKTTILLAIVNLATTLPVALVLLRRSEMIDVSIALIGAYWFARRKNFSLTAIAAVVVGLTVTVYSIGALRGAAHRIELATGQQVSLLSPDLWSKIDVGQTLTSSVAKAPDFANALYIIDYRQKTLDLSWGSTVWNGLVFQYVPGQILGDAFKRSLTIGDRGDIFAQIGRLYSFDYQVGTTATGFGSAFSDFWFFGAFYFFIMAAILKRFHIHATRGDLWSQILYLSLLPTALVALTHGHERFFVLIPFIYVVVLLLKRMAGYRRSGGKHDLRVSRMTG